MPTNVTAPSRVEFIGSQGDTLSGRLETPRGAPEGYAIFAHCFTCGKDAVAATRISRALTDAGIAVLRFDFTGLGQSTGDFGETTFSSNIGDLLTAAEHLRTHFQAPRLLIGHSLGGAAVLAAAEQIPEVRAVATIGAPADPRHVLRQMEGKVAEIDSAGSAWVDLGGRPFRIRREFIQDLQEHRQRRTINHLRPALLVMHAPEDRIVPIANAREIFDAAPHPKSFVALDGADHLLTQRPAAEFAAGLICAWARPYVKNADASSPSRQAEDETSALPDGVVRVTESGRGPYGQTVTTSHHELTADEPAPAGIDSGPSPYEYLLAALGACTSMTLRMYAQRKKWPIGEITVELSHSRRHADDCASCDRTPVAVDHIERTIRIAGDLTSEQHDALLAIADRCPVHRTLHGRVEVATALHAADDGAPAG